ncbi:MAG: hypothetical protein ACM3U2_00910 [Deltaproteobacteria bacterium]
MSIDTRNRPTQEQADLKHMIAHAFRGMPLDPEVARRVHDRAKKAREEIRASGAKMNAVDLIREAREEL